MIRFVLILALGLGLVVLVAGLAFADAPGAAGAAGEPTGAVCLEPKGPDAAPPQPKAGRCWKTLAAGVLVHDCNTPVRLVRTGIAFLPPAGPCRPPIAGPVPIATDPRTPESPPPKASPLV